MFTQTIADSSGNLQFECAGVRLVYRVAISLTALLTVAVFSYRSHAGFSSKSGLIPDMTDYSTPKGVVDSSDKEGKYLPWMAFDKNSKGTPWMADVERNKNPWLSYEFSSPVKINGYSLHAERSGRAPSHWKIEGFTKWRWVPLDARNGELSWRDTGNVKEFRVVSNRNQSFSKVRLTIYNATREDLVSLNGFQVYYDENEIKPHEHKECIAPGTVLGREDTIWSENREWVAKMKTNGEFNVLDATRNWKHMWTAGNSKNNTSECVFKSDGLFGRNVRTGKLDVFKYNFKNAKELCMRNDGLLVAYDRAGNQIWGNASTFKHDYGDTFSYTMNRDRKIVVNYSVWKVPGKIKKRKCEIKLSIWDKNGKQIQNFPYKYKEVEIKSMLQGKDKGSFEYTINTNEFHNLHLIEAECYGGEPAKPGWIWWD